MEILTKDFVEFIECCTARKVRFLVVGGYALAAHGHPRATKDLDFGAIEEGDVLIAPFTSPSFNSIFPLLGAVAVEEGGLMSHTAIVSREFDVPAVIGVAGLLSAVRTGDEVEIDPTTGTVTVDPG